jgi:uncharacterized RDD family membrane protein YckC
MNEAYLPPNPYAAPAAPVADDELPREQAMADRGTRLAASLLDAVSVFVVFIPMFIALPFVDANGAQGVDAAIVVGFVAMLLLGIGLIAWNCVLLSRNGQTLAKKLLGIRVVRADGSHCGLARIFFARYLPVAVLGAVPFIGSLFTLADALLIFRDNRRCIHDEFADTIVVKA